MESKIRSAESQFCVRRSDQNVACSGLSQKDVPTRVPELPPFECPTTTSSTSAWTETNIPTAEEIDTQTSYATTQQAQNETAITSNQGCCGPGLYALIVIIIVMFLILLVVIYLRCRRSSKLHAKYHTSSGNGPLASDTNKVEEANGTKIQNSAEAVPLKSHNWAED